MKGSNIFLVLCDNSLSKEARTIRKLLSEFGGYIINTINQVPLVINHQNFEDKLNHLLTSWSDTVIVLTSESFTGYIDEGMKTNDLPDLLIENHPQSQKVLKDFFTNDSEEIKSKIIAITLGDNDGLPQCLSHVQPVIIKDADNEVFVDTIRKL